MGISLIKAISFGGGGGIIPRYTENTRKPPPSTLHAGQSGR